LNRRPFGPQPNALPSCATPRDQRVYGRFGPTGMRTCVRVATRKPRTEAMRSLRAAQTRFRVQLAPKTAAATRQPLSPLPLRVQTGALRSQSATVHRSSPQAEAGAGARAHHLPDRVLRQPSMRGLRRDDPVVLEFDHLRDKLFDIGQSLPYRNWQTILDEIAKCDVLCANCHRRRTAKRRGSLRALLTEGT
jgi:hypothetical protein